MAMTKGNSHDSFNKSCNGAEDEAVNEALYIAVPESPGAGARSFVRSFNEVAKSPLGQLVGQVKDFSRFSAPVPGAGDKKINVDLAVKAPGTGFYIPPQYKQFMPEIERMIEHYYRTHGDDGPCIMSVRQGVTEPNGTSPFIMGHKDLTLARLKEGQGAPNSSVLIASDVLTTGFSGYELSVDDMARLQLADDPDGEFSEILEDKSVGFSSFASGSITEHSATTIHAIANPDTPTRRTAVIMVFHPEGEPLPEALNNPWLEKAMEDRAHKTEISDPGPGQR